MSAFNEAIGVVRSVEFQTLLNFLFSFAQFLFCLFVFLFVSFVFDGERRVHYGEVEGVAFYGFGLAVDSLAKRFQLFQCVRCFKQSP